MNQIAPVPRSPWSPEEDAELRRLAALTPTLSYTEIAVHIGRPRNACIGRAHRLKLPDRREFCKAGSPVKPRTSGVKRRRGPVSPTRIDNAKRKRTERPARPNQPPTRTVLLDGSAGCLWPCGDHPFVFCGTPVEKGLPYCGEHARVAYRPRRAA